MAASRGDAHNEAAARLMKEIVDAVGPEVHHVNVLVESLLLGAGIYNFPGDRRRQALIIQAIADAAIDRVTALAAKDR